MFDIGFSEILVIMVVALVVIGPERLPHVARSMGQWWGRIQRYVSKVKQDVSSSMELEELREAQRKVQAEMDELKRSVQNVNSEINQNLAMLEKELDAPANKEKSVPTGSVSGPTERP